MSSHADDFYGEGDSAVAQPTVCPECNKKLPMHKFNCPTRYAKIKLAARFKTVAIAYKPGHGPNGSGSGKIVALEPEEPGDPPRAVVTVEFSKSTFSTASCATFIDRLRDELGCFNDFTVVVDGGAGWKTLHADDSVRLSDVASDKSNIHVNIIPMRLVLHCNPNQIVFDETAAKKSSAHAHGQSMNGTDAARVHAPKSPLDLTFPDGESFPSMTLADLRLKIRQALRAKSIVTRIEVGDASGNGKTVALQGSAVEHKPICELGIVRSGTELYLRFQDKNIEVSIPRSSNGVGIPESPKLLPVVAPPPAAPSPKKRGNTGKTSKRKSAKNMVAQPVQKWLSYAFFYKSKDLAKKACRAGHVLYGYHAGRGANCSSKSQKNKKKKNRRNRRHGATTAPPPSPDLGPTSTLRFAPCKPTKEIRVGDQLKIYRIAAPSEDEPTSAKTGTSVAKRSVSASTISGKPIHVIITALLTRRCRAEARVAFRVVNRSTRNKQSTDDIITMFHDVAKDTAIANGHGGGGNASSFSSPPPSTLNRGKHGSCDKPGRPTTRLGLTDVLGEGGSPVLFSPGGRPRRRSDNVDELLHELDFGDDKNGTDLVKAFFGEMVRAPQTQVDITGGDTSHNYAIGNVFVKQLDETPTTTMLDPEQAGFLLGEGPWREEAAYVIDRSYASFSGVPVTKTVMVRKGGGTPIPPQRSRARAASFGSSAAPGMENGNSNLQVHRRAKPVILQRFLQGLSNCEDRNLNTLLKSLPPIEVHKVAVFDLRFFNTDRHGGNLMVTAPRPEDVSSTTKLIPIDHAYCLPDFLHLGAPKYEWCECSQAAVPVSRETAALVAEFDAARDAEVLRSLRIREACIVTLVLATRLLQLGLREGRTLLDIARIQQRKDPSRSPQVRPETPPTSKATLQRTSNNSSDDDLQQPQQQKPTLLRKNPATTAARGLSDVRSATPPASAGMGALDFLQAQGRDTAATVQSGSDPGGNGAMPVLRAATLPAARNRTASLGSLQSLSSLGNDPADDDDANDMASVTTSDVDGDDGDDAFEEESANTGEGSSSSSSSSDSDSSGSSSTDDSSDSGSSSDESDSGSDNSDVGASLEDQISPVQTGAVRGEGDIDFVLRAEVLSDFERLVCSSLVESLQGNEDALVHYLLCSEALRAYYASVKGTVKGPSATSCVGDEPTGDTASPVLKRTPKRERTNVHSRRGWRGRRRDRRKSRSRSRSKHSRSPAIKPRAAESCVDVFDLDGGASSVGSGAGSADAPVTPQDSDNANSENSPSPGLRDLSPADGADNCVDEADGWELEDSSDSSSYTLQLCSFSDSLLQHLLHAGCINDRVLIKQLHAQRTTTTRDYLDYVNCFDEGFSGGSTLGAAFSIDMRGALSFTVETGRLAPAVSAAAARKRLELPPLPSNFLSIFDRNLDHYFRTTATLSEHNLKRYYSSSAGSSHRRLRRYYKSTGSSFRSNGSDSNPGRSSPPRSATGGASKTHGGPPPPLGLAAVLNRKTR